MSTKDQPKEEAPDGPKTCFVVSPIGEDGSPIRRHADQLLKHIIRPVVEAFGYKVVRADDIAEPGLITHQIVEQLIDADLVVADLTEHNPNVFYELALRHGLMKPVVQMIHVGQKLPFDVAGARAIFFDLRDLDAAEAAKEQLRKQVEVVKGGVPVSNPFSVVFELRQLSGSEDPDDQFKVTVLEELRELRNGDEPIRASLDVLAAAVHQLRAEVKQNTEIGFVQKSFYSAFRKSIDDIKSKATEIEAGLFRIGEALRDDSLEEEERVVLRSQEADLRKKLSDMKNSTISLPNSYWV